MELLPFFTLEQKLNEQQSIANKNNLVYFIVLKIYLTSLSFLTITLFFIGSFTSHAQIVNKETNVAFLRENATLLQSKIEANRQKAFAIAKDTSGLTSPEAIAKLEAEVMKVVDTQLGAVARPARVRFVNALPKTRSGKLLRRAIQAVCEGRDPGDLTTMEDPSALAQIKTLVDAK